jgi:hypothetical protein
VDEDRQPAKIAELAELRTLTPRLRLLELEVPQALLKLGYVAVAGHGDA